MKKIVFKNLKKFKTIYSEYEYAKYTFIHNSVVNKQVIDVIKKCLDDNCDWFILSSADSHYDDFVQIQQLLGKEIAQIGYIQHLPNYRTNKQLALKINYSYTVVKILKQYFKAPHFLYLSSQWDTAYYKQDMCLLSQNGETNGVYVLNRLELSL